MLPSISRYCGCSACVLYNACPKRAALKCSLCIARGKKKHLAIPQSVVWWKVCPCSKNILLPDSIHNYKYKESLPFQCIFYIIIFCCQKLKLTMSVSCRQYNSNINIIQKVHYFVTLRQTPFSPFNTQHGKRTTIPNLHNYK